MVSPGDPRLARPDLTAGEVLLDRSIRHAIRLERLKAGEVRRILRFLDERLYPDVLGLLTERLERIKVRGFDTGLHSTARLRALGRALDRLVIDRTRHAHLFNRDALVEIANAEAEWQAGVLRTASPVRFQTALPSAGLLRSVVTSRPFQGRFLREWWRRQGQATQRSFRDAVNLGLAEGEPTARIVQRVRQTVQTSRRGAEAIVRTAVNHTTAQARDATYQENADIVKGWQFVATLDTRTTPECQSLDGQTFELGKGPKPPRHMGCRSADIPLLRSWRELDLDLADFPAGTRASLDGQVPSTLTYGEWLRRQPAARQVEALGATRARLFRRGGLSVDRFVDRTGATITLDRLRELEADAFEAIGAV